MSCYLILSGPGFKYYYIPEPASLDGRVRGRSCRNSRSCYFSCVVFWDKILNLQSNLVLVAQFSTAVHISTELIGEAWLSTLKIEAVRGL